MRVREKAGKNSNGTIGQKMAALKANIREMDSLIVAYSGGVDSTFLSATANEVLGTKALAITASSPSLAPSELNQALATAECLELNHRVIRTEEVNRADYQANNSNRCFFCKDELYTRLTGLAEEEGYAYVANGTNIDDLEDFRPGLNAAAKYGVRSPMVEAGLTKKEIRTLSHEIQLPTWDKPAQACLSSRIPYGTPVTLEALSRIAKAEAFLHELGVNQVRVRDHGATARIEVDAPEIAFLVEENVRKAITRYFRSIGYIYVALDLEGFKSGSLNKMLLGSRANSGTDTGRGRRRSKSASPQ